MRSHDWTDESTLVVDGVEFVARTTSRFTSTSSRFCLVKRPNLVQAYIDLIADLQPRRIVELGVFQGGSAALMALLAEPDRLVALERSEDRVEGLDALIQARGLGGAVHAIYGVDQGDAARVSSVIEEHFEGEPIDLVVDDASHLVKPTRTSFDALFPRLRPGGMFIVEDWSWAHIGYGLHLPDEVPLTQVVFELVMALPSQPGLISEVRMTRDWAVVVRGDAPVDRGRFRLADAYSERGRGLLAGYT